jgi:chromosome segregation ATPase
MSYDSRIISVDNNNKKSDNSTIAVYHGQFDYSVSFTSSLVVHLRHLHTSLHAQHQHEKSALVELNERFRHFVEHVHQLEAQNTKYLSQLGQYQYQSSGSASVSTEVKEHYLHIQSDLTAVTFGKVDFELEFEMFHLQAAIYQQLIDTEQQWKDERRLKLEQELSQISSTANTLRTSYAEVSREVERLYKARADSSQQYLSLTSEWCRVKKTTKQWQLSLQTLKSHLAFYKNLSSYSVRSV